MGRTIYAVSSGSYSDYRVNALFSTRAKAEEFRQVVPDGDYNDIEEYEMDPPTVDLLRRGYSPWHVLMRRDGQVERADKKDISIYGVEVDATPRLWKRSIAPAYAGKNIPDVLMCDVWAKNEKSAIKVANERRTRFIASGEWDATNG